MGGEGIAPRAGWEGTLRGLRWEQAIPAGPEPPVLGPR